MVCSEVWLLIMVCPLSWWVRVCGGHVIGGLAEHVFGVQCGLAALFCRLARLRLFNRPGA